MAETFVDRFAPHISMLKYWSWWKVYCNRIVSVFKLIILLTCKIFSISDGALLARAKRQSLNKRHGLISTCKIVSISDDAVLVRVKPKIF